jgi:hypothetical protein
VVAFYPPTDFLALQELATEETHEPGGGARTLELDRVSDALLARLFNLQSDDDGTETSFRDMIPDMIGGTPDEIPEVYRLLSPIYHVGPHCPPTLL